MGPATQSISLKGLLLLLAAFGCEFETEGLTDLFATSPQYVRFPGRQLASGRYSRLSLDGTRTEQGFVEAIDEENELWIHPFGGDGGCRVGPAVHYWPFLSHFGLQDLTGYVPYRQSYGNDGRDALRFTDYHCQRSALEADSVGYLRPWSSAAFPTAFVAWDEGRRLTLLDPRSKQEVILGEAVSYFELGQSDEYIWLIDAGRLVVRDVAGDERHQYGNGVTALRLFRFPLEFEQPEATLRPTDPTLASGPTLGQSEWAYFTDDEGLKRVGAPGEAAELLLEDACEVVPIELGIPMGQMYALATLSPCAERRLVVLNLAGGAVVPLAENAEPGLMSLPLRREDGTAHYYFYITNADAKSELGTLWARDGAKSMRIGERTSLDSLTLWQGDHVAVLLDQQDNVGNLVLWSPDGARVLAQGVPRVGLPPFIRDFDGTAGTLCTLTSDGEILSLAEGVPSEGYPWADHWAVLSEYDGALGTLLLMPVTQSSTGPDRGRPEVIATGIPEGGYRLLSDADALAYLTGYNPTRQSGRLEVRFLKSGDTFGVDGVTEWQATTWPDRGIIYAVSEGERAGIWFAAFEWSRSEPTEASWPAR